MSVRLPLREAIRLRLPVARSKGTHETRLLVFGQGSGFRPTWLAPSFASIKFLYIKESSTSSTTLGTMKLSFFALMGLGSASGADYANTSLERLLTRAFNAKIADGTWASVLGSAPDLLPQPFCGGATEDWPIPDVQAGTLLGDVFETGTFYCGIHQNIIITVPVDSNSSKTLLETGNSSSSFAQGAIVEYWQGMIDYVNTLQLGTKNITLEWKIFPTAQDALSAVEAGGIHAVCGLMAPDGTFQPNFVDRELARASYLSAQTCPSFLQLAYIWAPVDAAVSSFSDLVDSGTVSKVCVSGSPGGGYETSCQNAFDLQAGAGVVTCTGYGTGQMPFDLLAAGTCDAVWDGYPSNASGLMAIPRPYLYSPVSFFKQTEELTQIEPNITSLELAFTHAFETLVTNGEWNSIFGGRVGIQPTGFCPGNVMAWPIPEPKQDSDLQAVLDRGSFRWYVTYNDSAYPCYSSPLSAYAGNVTYRTVDGEIIIGTDEPDNVTGLLADLFQSIVAEIGATYGVPDLKLEWILNDTAQDSLLSVYEGQSDAACGYWYPVGTFVEPMSNKTVARPVAFSMTHCPTFYENNVINTLADSGIDSFASLAEAIRASGGVVTMCVPGTVARKAGIVVVCVALVEPA